MVSTDHDIENLNNLIALTLDSAQGYDYSPAASFLADSTPVRQPMQK
jgi:hypothetical protein